LTKGARNDKRTAWRGEREAKDGALPTEPTHRAEQHAFAFIV